MNNELRDAIREIVYPSKAEWEWYDDLGAVADERVEAVLQAISDAGYVLVDRDRAGRIHAFLYELATLGYERGVDDEVRELCDLLLTGEDTSEKAWGLNE